MLGRRTLLASLGAMTVAARSQPAIAPPRVPAPDRELMVPVPGGRLYVRVNGDLAGPRAPLVMIHGGPGGAHNSLARALPLADERAVILYDQLDCGRSEGRGDPADWRIERFVAEIEAVRAALGVRSWHVLGHSWGGTLALEHGARRPADVRSLILSSPLVSTGSWIADTDRQRAALPADVQATLTACDTTPSPDAVTCDAATQAFYARHYMRLPRAPEIVAYMAAQPRTFTRTQYEAMWGRTEFVCTGTLKTYDGEPLLTLLDGPRTLFMTGEHDEAQPATVAGFARQVPGATFAMIPNAGHSTLNDNQPAVLATLRGWLRRHDGVVA